MALPYVFTNSGNPVIDADQFNANFNYLDVGGRWREAVVAAISADGGNTTIPFSPPFSTIGVVDFGVANYTGSDNAAISVRIVGTPSITGFTVAVGGGQSGTKIDLHYRASGT